jgi:hypothetical protein
LTAGAPSPFPCRYPISSRTSTIGRIADVAARSISVGVEALRPHLRRIVERARASILDASRFQAWMMITIQPEIIAIPDRAAMAIIAATLFVSAATADDPALRKAARMQKESRLVLQKA